MAEKKRLGDIVYRDPASLIAYDRNSRKHSPTQVRQIRASIDKFGFTNPVLLHDGTRLVAGHGRCQAALLEPPLKQIPTIAISGLTKAEIRALVIADNKLALNASWDTDMLAAELHDLGVAGFDLPLIGFTDGELADLSDPEPPKAGAGASNPDEVTCPQCQHRFVPE